MSKIVVIGAGAMGTAFTFPCFDNNHDINIIGTHLENDFIDSVLKNKRLISKKYKKLKILGTGEIKDKIDITAHFASKQAQDKIKKAGCTLNIVKKNIVKK